MSEIGVISVVFLVLIILIIGVLFVIITKIKTVKVVEEEVKKVDDRISLKQLIQIASNRNSSKNELSAAVLEMVKSFPFPPKKDDSTPLTDKQKVYLSFVLLIASHKNSDAKLIAHMDKELKKKNPAYNKEIDTYESQGIEQRNLRV